MPRTRDCLRHLDQPGIPPERNPGVSGGYGSTSHSAEPAAHRYSRRPSFGRGAVDVSRAVPYAVATVIRNHQEQAASTPDRLVDFLCPRTSRTRIRFLRVGWGCP